MTRREEMLALKTRTYRRCPNTLTGKHDFAGHAYGKNAKKPIACAQCYQLEPGLRIANETP